MNNKKSVTLKKQYTGYYLLLMILCFFVFFVLDLFSGSVSIPFNKVWSILTGDEMQPATWEIIILNFRLPKAITATLVGAALSVCGLQMQTFFRNPLAGPFVLGISSGASLGVAIVMMAAGLFGGKLLYAEGMANKISVIMAASIGSGLILLLIVLVSKKIKDNMTLLILGLMFGHITGAMEGILQYFSSAENLQGFIIWSLGNFSNVVWDEMIVLAPTVTAGLILAFILSKPLNAMLLGENYAHSMGVNIKRARLWIIISMGLLAGSITAFCGPIAFLGIAVPHLTRNMFNTSDHKILIPAVCLQGAILALVCDIIAHFPGTQQNLPINAVTSLIGAPIVIWVIIKQKNVKQSFS